MNRSSLHVSSMDVRETAARCLGHGFVELNETKQDFKLIENRKSTVHADITAEITRSKVCSGCIGAPEKGLSEDMIDQQDGLIRLWMRLIASRAN